ncbi:MAG: UDP-N-acetylmuramoyl-L-alanine--D-glutamate ligase [Chlamydiota bacterium]|nr:UDP-N-acetylmuramoyl-L-alanine--D-glutamate ligase [Chlamydiota bacterium]
MKRKTALVVGLGATGLAVTNLLRAQGYKVRVTESDNGPKVKEKLIMIPASDVDIEIGNHSRNFCLEADFAVISPGIDPHKNPVRWLYKAGKKVYSELEWAARSIQQKIIAVTGSYGKTTTVHMLEAILQGAGISVVRAGNSHQPLSAKVLEQAEAKYWIVELSSYQLELFTQFKPWIGMILNISPHHLDRHKTFKRYRDAKLRLLQCFNGTNIAVLDNTLKDILPPKLSQKLKNTVWVGGQEKEDDISANMTGQLACLRKGQWQEELFPLESLKLNGKHHIHNAIFAATAAYYCGVSASSIAKALSEFTGLEHRQEVFAHYGGALWVNDSKATGVPAVKSALENFDAPIVWIAGGKGVGIDFSELFDLVGKKVKKAYFYGEDRHMLSSMFASVCPVYQARDMDTVAHVLSRDIQKGDVVLLSPGLQSFDQFTNFEERGYFYKACVSRLWTGHRETFSALRCEKESVYPHHDEKDFAIHNLSRS